MGIPDEHGRLVYFNEAAESIIVFRGLRRVAAEAPW
jgi:hypothetical protein